MFILTNEIIALLKEHDFGYPKVLITRSFDASDKTFPKIVVRQNQNATLIRDRRGDELHIIAFQFEIYTKDAVKDGEVLHRDDVNDDIANQIDEIMYNRYKLNHDDTTEVYKYSKDTSMRLMRYSGVIDKFGYTYRSSKFPYGGYTYENFY